ncbi:MAG TPA: type II toxin-antitoxin system RelE/ParE family toxin [Clostridiaceae bacterium]|nr:type II toxin-antitoxin system RelE/ParE family toxin [Clostridiaceae bacterium]
MGKKLQGVFYTTTTGKSPVEEWINKQSVKVQAKMLRYMDHLETYWDQGPFRFVRNLGDGLYEIKAEIDNAWPRIVYYYYDKDHIIYLHGFLKKQNKTPRKEVNTANSRRNDYICRREKKNETKT